MSNTANHPIFSHYLKESLVFDFSSVLTEIYKRAVISINFSMVKHLAISIVVLQLAFLAYGFEIRPRIVNGDPGNNHEFPFYVKIGVSGSAQFCGGTLISDR